MSRKKQSLRLLKPNVSKSSSMFHTFNNYATILVPKERKNKQTNKKNKNKNHAQPKYIIQQYA